MVKTQKKSSVPALVHLSVSQVKRLPKPRKGYAAFAPRLAALVDDNPETLTINGLDTKAMLDEAQAAEAVHAVVVRLRDELAMAMQTELMHHSNVWRDELRIYACVKALAHGNQSLLNGLADFEAFLKRGPRRTAAAAAKTAITAPAATPAAPTS